jgi:mitogen-activated protein kinase kinase kinase
LVVEMLTGSRPWPDLTQMQALFRVSWVGKERENGGRLKADLCVCRGHPQIGSSAKPSIPGDISADAVDFLTRTFEIDHTKRPHASELLMHPFIVDQ